MSVTSIPDPTPDALSDDRGRAEFAAYQLAMVGAAASLRHAVYHARSYWEHGGDPGVAFTAIDEWVRKVTS